MLADDERLDRSNTSPVCVKLVQEPEATPDWMEKVTRLVPFDVVELTIFIVGSVLFVQVIFPVPTAPLVVKLYVSRLIFDLKTEAMAGSYEKRKPLVPPCVQKTIPPKYDPGIEFWSRVSIRQSPSRASADHIPFSTPHIIL